MAEKVYRVHLIVKSNQSPGSQDPMGIFEIFAAAKSITAKLGPEFTVMGCGCEELTLKLVNEGI